MSENIYAEPGITNTFRSDQDNKDSIVDIYVSAESLRVYDNPWVESTSPNTPGPAGPQHPVSLVGENSEKRDCTRADSVFQRVLYLLLLAGILALIVLGVQLKYNKTDWRSEKKDLQELREQLTANYTELSGKIDRLWQRLCELRPKKCKSPEWSRPSREKGAGNGWMGDRR